jgi:hypothetical protein
MLGPGLSPSPSGKWNGQKKKVLCLNGNTASILKVFAAVFGGKGKGRKH